MPILNIQIGQSGLVGVIPSISYIATNDTLGTVLGTGYLNNAVQQGYAFSESMMCLVSTKTTPSSTTTEVAWLEVSYVAPDWSLVAIGSPGTVILPTIANHIATYTNTTGTLSEDATIAINGGSLQAGLSGTAGSLFSYPATAARGKLAITAVANTGNTDVNIINAAHGQASTYTIPDGGQTNSSFLITNSSGTQTIATGSLALTLGNLTVAAGNIAATLGSVTAGTTVTAGTGITATTGNITASAGNLVAGATGAAGTVTSFSGTGSAEFLRLAAVDNAGGNFSTTISNAASVGQSQVISIPDAASATGQFLIKSAAFVNGNLIQASGTAGLTVDSGVATTNVQLKTQVKAATTANIGGAGAGPLTIAVAGLTAASVVVATIATSSNTVAVAKAVAGTDNFDLLLTGDPGATLTVNYVAYIAAQ